MRDSEDRTVRTKKMLAREGASIVYVEPPKWFFVARLKTVEVDDWGVKATVQPLPVFGLTSPPQDFTVSGAWEILSLTASRWSALYSGWSIVFGEDVVARLTSRAVEIAHLSSEERIRALVHSLSGLMRNSEHLSEP